MTDYRKGDSFPLNVDDNFSPSQAPLCLRCATRMEFGITIDYFGKGGQRQTNQQWLRGTLEESTRGNWFFSYFSPKPGDLKPVVSYRCRACGCLENFAL